jgi:hypothetical protein
MTESSPNALLKQVRVKGHEVALELMVLPFKSKPTVSVVLLSASVDEGGNGTPLTVDVVSQLPMVVLPSAVSVSVLLQPSYAVYAAVVSVSAAPNMEHAGHARRAASTDSSVLDAVTEKRNCTGCSTAIGDQVAPSPLTASSALAKLLSNISMPTIVESNAEDELEDELEPPPLLLLFVPGTLLSLYEYGSTHTSIPNSWYPARASSGGISAETDAAVPTAGSVVATLSMSGTTSVLSSPPLSTPSSHTLCTPCCTRRAACARVLSISVLTVATTSTAAVWPTFS